MMWWKWTLSSACALCLNVAQAQDTLRGRGGDPDIELPMPEVVIKAFESGRRLSQTPGSVGYVATADLQRTAGTSFLPAFNMIPGVRMEERSPDSYRLSIRGSVIAAPFGVTNVKVYWNDLPLTDAGGNTYLNVLDMQAFLSAEILKGPASSMYGAGTGGVLILTPDTSTHARVQLRGGSYNTWGEDALFSLKSNTLFQSHAQSNGYRDHSASYKDVYQDWGSANLARGDRLSWMASYTDLYYQTPGGLTLPEMEQNPKADRPNTSIPGATQQNAGIYAQTWYAGLSNGYAAGGHWYNTTSVLASGTHFDNPFLTDYEQRRELTLEALTRWLFKTENWRVIFGAEYQYTRSYIHDWGNDRGNPDTTQSNNRLQAYQFNPYAQVNLTFARNWLIQAGISANTFQYHYLPLYGPNTAEGDRLVDFHLQVMPRVSLQYSLRRDFLLYGTLSRGYSPPTIAQIFPGTALLYNNLQPEQGWNAEVGVKSYFWYRRLLLTMSLYDFRMKQSIVPRYDSAGHAYYVNAGGTDQKGLEAGFTATPIGFDYGNGPDVYGVPKRTFQYLRLFASYALQNYHFRNYEEGAVSYSGNPLTGVPRNVLVGGIDWGVIFGMYLNVTNTYTSSIPLNDADTARARAYDLIQVRLGREWVGKWNPIGRGYARFNVYVGVDNLLNQVYSLGDDLNAAGGRYYNPSPARNWFAGVGVKL